MLGNIEDGYREAIATFGRQTQITGIDIGPKYTQGKRTEQLAIRFHVVVKRPRSALTRKEVFPEAIQGFPVDVLPRNYVPAIEGLLMNANAADGAAERSSTLGPGISISHRLCPSGTLGLIVRDLTDRSLALLTNWHILADSSFAKPGDAVTQPGATDGGTATDNVAVLRRSILEAAGDAAIATLDSTRPVTFEVPGVDAVPAGVRNPVRDEIVVKYGRTTGLTEGRVEGFGTYFPIYRTRDRVGIEGFEIVPVDRSNPANIELSANGDSGSVLLAKGSNEVVGLLFAGERDPAPEKEVMIACFAPRVFDQLNIALP